MKHHNTKKLFVFYIISILTCFNLFSQSGLYYQAHLGSVSNEKINSGIKLNNVPFFEDDKINCNFDSHILVGSLQNGSNFSVFAARVDLTNSLNPSDIRELTIIDQTLGRLNGIATDVVQIGVTRLAIVGYVNNNLNDDIIVIITEQSFNPASAIVYRYDGGKNERANSVCAIKIDNGDNNPDSYDIALTGYSENGGNKDLLVLKTKTNGPNAGSITIPGIGWNVVYDISHGAPNPKNELGPISNSLKEDGLDLIWDNQLNRPDLLTVVGSVTDLLGYKSGFILNLNLLDGKHNGPMRLYDIASTIEFNSIKIVEGDGNFPDGFLTTGYGYFGSTYNNNVVALRLTLANTTVFPYYWANHFGVVDGYNDDYAFENRALKRELNQTPHSNGGFNFDYFVIGESNNAINSVSGKDVVLYRLNSFGNVMDHTIYGGMGHDVGRSIDIPKFDTYNTTNPFLPGIGIYGYSDSYGYGINDGYLINSYLNGVNPCDFFKFDLFQNGIDFSAVYDLYLYETNPLNEIQISFNSNALNASFICEPALIPEGENTIMSGKEEITKDISDCIVYPNLIQQSQDIIFNVQMIHEINDIRIFDNLGKEINFKIKVIGNNSYEVHLNPDVFCGIYHIEIITKQSKYIKKLLIN